MSIPATDGHVHPAPTHPEVDSLRPERDQTDESLRVERVSVDQADEQRGLIDETADAVVSRARARADAVLAAARARTDRQSARPAATAIIGRQRALEDQAVRTERADADQTLREERAEHVALLSIEREETDQDLLAERTRSDDALAMRDDVLGIVSHDLRNILSAITGFAVLVETGSPKEVSEYAQRIRRSAARMDRLIGDLVDVASIAASRLAMTREVGDPTQVVSEAVELFQPQASARGVSLAAEIVPPSWLAVFDAARILQVLTNLLSNAIKFTPPGGNVVVRVARVGDEIRFAVEDTGTGIPDDKLKMIFDRFVQVARNDRRGVGLGLYISKCIVQEHGGRIWAESHAGRGSTISFTLPIHVEP